VYVATCLEFPSFSWLAETRNAAIDGLEALVAEVFEDMQAEGEEVPVPMSERRYSGIFNVRIGETLQRSLAMHAAEERVSLNQYVTKKLASGWCSASERCASSPGAAMPGDAPSPARPAFDAQGPHGHEHHRLVERGVTFASVGDQRSREAISSLAASPTTQRPSACT